jgi:hypothetical protein
MPDHDPGPRQPDHTGSVYPDDQPPGVGPLRALADRAELADAACAVTDGYGQRLPAHDPLAPLAWDVARSLVEAGFTLHHCAPWHPLRRLGGVCLLPVARPSDPGGHAGIVVSWTAHDLLFLDWDRQAEYHGAHDVMNSALAQVLDALRYQLSPFGSGGAWIVTGHQDHSPGPGR